MKLIEYLHNNSLEELELELGIKTRRHEKYPNLISLAYSQIDSPPAHPVVIECRGIILDESNNWSIVCRSFDRFFNYEEEHAAKIDWCNARVYKKEDGSLCQLYYYDNEWQVATSGSPDAGGNINDFNKTFKDLFWETWEDLNYKLPNDPNICYAFELTTPFNAIVIQHQDSLITLLGARNLSTQGELNPIAVANQNGWQCVKVFDFENQDEVENILKNMDGSEQEGFVVCDVNNYNRVKMKCSDYVKKHRLVSHVSQRNMLDAVRANEGDEILLYCPQFEKLYWEIKYKYGYTLGEIEGFYDAIKNIEQQKDFASRATEKKFSDALFSMRNKKINSFSEYMSGMKIRTLEKWLGMKNDKSVEEECPEDTQES